MAITVDGAYYPVIGYSGGVNTFTFNAAAGGAVGDIVIVAVSCHASIGAFAAVAGWNFLGMQRPSDGLGPQVAVYWRKKLAGDVSYVFNSGNGAALDANAAGQLIFIRGIDVNALPVIGVAGMPAYDYTFFFEFDSPVKTKTIATVADAKSNEVVMAFAFSNWQLLNVRQYGFTPGGMYPTEYNSTSTIDVASPTPLTNFCGASFGGTSVDVSVNVHRALSAGYGHFEQCILVAAWFTLRPKKVSGMFGVNH